MRKWAEVREVSEVSQLEALRDSIPVFSGFGLNRKQVGETSPAKDHPDMRFLRMHGRVSFCFRLLFDLCHSLSLSASLSLSLSLCASLSLC